MLLTESARSARMSCRTFDEYLSCTLCPRECHADRAEGHRGLCGADSRIIAARAALHMWEEPCISGTKGSGTVFFSGCSLGCIYCQNRTIARMDAGKEISIERLSEIFLELQEKGAANVSLVTACHYVPQVIRALDSAKAEGLSIPVVYNSGGYEKVETLRMLEGYVDIYLPDYKYDEPETAKKFSHAPDYPEYAREAIKEMVRQTGECEFDTDGYLKKGTIVRHLILPGHTKNSIKALTWLHETFGEKIYLSIMNQYTPIISSKDYPELNRRLTKREYEKVLAQALNQNIKNAYIQEGKTSNQTYIPPFNNEGL